MTQAETDKITKAALNAQANGRSITVLAATRDPDGGSAEYVALAFTKELLNNPQHATMIAIPRRDAEMLVMDLTSALTGLVQTVDDGLLQTLTKKGLPS